MTPSFDSVIFIIHLFTAVGAKLACTSVQILAAAGAAVECDAQEYGRGHYHKARKNQPFHCKMYRQQSDHRAQPKQDKAQAVHGFRAHRPSPFFQRG